MKAHISPLLHGSGRISDFLHKTVPAVIIVLIVVLVAAPVLADGRHGGGRSHFTRHSHHSHSRVGIGFYYGGPYWDSPGYYPYPYYYAPYYPYYVPDVQVQTEPPVYIEKNAPREEPPPAVWYYCPESETYYPYVRECPGGWEKVPAQPPEAGR